MHYASFHIEMFKSPRERKGQVTSDFLKEGTDEGKQRTLGVLNGGFVIVQRGLALGNIVADIPC